MQITYTSLDNLPCPLFFTTEHANSLTTTSANHIANLAKQAYAEAETFIKSCGFLTKNLSVIGSDVQNEITVGMTAEDLNKIASTLNLIGRYKGLIAWLREAIKAKEAWTSDITSSISVESWCELSGKEYPDYPYSNSRPTWVQAKDKLNVKELATYLKDEAMAATYGAFLHTEGSPGRKAYNELLNRIRNPKETELCGRDTLIISYSPTVNPDDVTVIMDQLRNEWRSYEAQVNKVKYALEEADSNASRAYNNDIDAKRRKCMTERDLLQNEFNTWVEGERKRIQTLRIVVPEMYKDLVEYLNSLGKQDKKERD